MTMRLPLFAALALCLVRTALCFAVVDQIEYFFDADPGPGNGVQIFERSAVDIDEAISTAALSPGIHRLFVRSRNDGGVWSLPRNLVFFIPYDAPPLETRTVAALEYFFDADPGPGNGIQIFARNTVLLDEVIVTSALPAGIHRLYVRTRDDEGVWSLPRSQVFFIPYNTSLFEERTVAAVEYYFDADPGPGNGIQIYGRNAVELDQLISTATLPAGIHRIFVRALDSAGRWSLPRNLVFFIPHPAALPGAEITRLEYFIDNDRGFGNGTLVDVANGISMGVSLPLFIGPIEHGNHTLFVRGQNTQGSWGFPVSCQFSDGIPAQLTITIDAGNVILSWEDLYAIDTYKVYSAPLPEGGFAEDSSGTFGTSDWTAPATGPKKFFRVTSVYEEGRE